MSDGDFPPRQDMEDLKRLAEIGYAKGIKAKLDKLETTQAASVHFIELMRGLVKGFEFHRMIQLVGDKL